MDTTKAWWTAQQYGVGQAGRPDPITTREKGKILREEIARKAEERDPIEATLRQAWADVNKYEARRDKLQQKTSFELAHHPQSRRGHQRYPVPGAFETDNERSAPRERAAQSARADNANYNHESDTNSEATTIRLPNRDDEAVRQAVVSGIVARGDGFRVGVRGRVEALVEMIRRKDYADAVASLGQIARDIVTQQSMQLRIVRTYAKDANDLLVRYRQESSRTDISRQLRYDVDRMTRVLFPDGSTTDGSVMSM